MNKIQFSLGLGVVLVSLATVATAQGVMDAAIFPTAEKYQVHQGNKYNHYTPDRRYDYNNGNVLELPNQAPQPSNTQPTGYKNVTLRCSSLADGRLICVEVDKQPVDQQVTPYQRVYM